MCPLRSRIVKGNAMLNKHADLFTTTILYIWKTIHNLRQCHSHHLCYHTRMMLMMMVVAAMTTFWCYALPPGSTASQIASMGVWPAAIYFDWVARYVPWRWWSCNRLWGGAICSARRWGAVAIWFLIKQKNSFGNLIPRVLPCFFLLILHPLWPDAHDARTTGWGSCIPWL